MPKKLAFFVEGQTEQVFIQKLLLEIAGRHNITIDVVQTRGSGPARTVVISGHSAANTQYYALVCDCGTDNRVASDINDNYSGLIAQGFSFILGLRDVYPEPDAKIPAMRAAIAKILPKGTIAAHLVLAIREIEAWFIVEDRHYPAIHPDLTPELIKARLNIDTRSVAAESIAHPAGTLHDIYQLQGRGYINKKRWQVERTVHALDYA